MLPLNKPVHRLKLLLESCAIRDHRYRPAAQAAGHAAGPTPAYFARLMDFSDLSDQELIKESRQHLHSMLVCCVGARGQAPELHQHLKHIESRMP